MPGRDEDHAKILRLGAGVSSDPSLSFLQTSMFDPFEILVEITDQNENGILTYSISTNDGLTSKVSNEPIDSQKIHSLGHGTNLALNFSTTENYTLGDAWEITVSPRVRPVAISYYGNVSERLVATRNALIRAINQYNIEGGSSIRARESVSTGFSGFGQQTLSAWSMDLTHDGGYPIKDKIEVYPTSPMTYKDTLPLAMSHTSGQTGTITLIFVPVQTSFPLSLVCALPVWTIREIGGIQKPTVLKCGTLSVRLLNWSSLLPAGQSCKSAKTLPVVP